MKPIRFVTALLIAAAPIALPAQPAAPQSAQTDAIAAAAPEIDRMMADFALDSHAPGLAYGIVADGRLVYFRGLGVQDIEAKRPVTADSLFRIASMTKAFTALAILKLRDDGKLSLDDLAEKHVPEMRGWRYLTTDSPRIRIRDLLSHTAGFVTDNPWGDRQQPMSEPEFTRILKTGVPMSRAPGTAMEYSNFGYALLGRIVANVSGMPYRTYVERNILTPLGMRSTGFEVAEAPAEQRAIGYRWKDGGWAEEPTMKHGVFGAMGGLQTSANDYAKYVAWLLAAWPPRDGADPGPVRRASVRELAQGSNFVSVARRRGKTGATACQVPSAYGKGMSAAVDCDLGLTLGHSGGYPGYGSYVLLLPEHGIGFFAFSNRTYNAPVPQVWDAAVALSKAGALTGRAIAVTPLLEDGYAAARLIFAAGDVNAARNRLAMNFLMDKPVEEWRAELGTLQAAVGTCDTNTPITATTAMAGRFTWRCEHGRIQGELLLAPSPTAEIQELHYSVVAQ
ncbi:serine hydrolase domain-containing protein [Allosphingosinicella indica]|uniref:CubicO group peptidase, beta-lactamase class C family n=1 Tax=Allosphingosinicella indica TaxID=941907 RepID=A0A1X7GYS8_9SPHN|nr:serine hydrolase domain-containing protein [Allosphingosinicella indica]SMF76032.1 CubicO group peptidase, beta-lactamase class C family [Allosphingosinicella indica]